MKYDDLNFIVKSEDGQEISYDILSVIPNNNNKEEPYVVFTDYLLDDDDEFMLQYGKIVPNGENYVLKPIDDNTTIEYIKEQLSDEVVDYVNTQIDDHLCE